MEPNHSIIMIVLTIFLGSIFSFYAAYPQVSNNLSAIDEKVVNSKTDNLENGKADSPEVSQESENYGIMDFFGKFIQFIKNFLHLH